MGSCCSKVTPEGVANENSITQKHGGYGYGKTSVAAGTHDERSWNNMATSPRTPNLFRILQLDGLDPDGDVDRMRASYMSAAMSAGGRTDSASEMEEAAQQLHHSSLGALSAAGTPKTVAGTPKGGPMAGTPKALRGAVGAIGQGGYYGMASAGAEGHPQPAEIGDQSAVKVAVLVRPLLEFEAQKGCADVVQVTGAQRIRLPAKPNGVGLPDATGGYQFEFDRVYRVDDERVSREVFSGLALRVAERFCQGFNACVLAYGQTGSGKTYTMGTSAWSGASGTPQGIIPRLMTSLFGYVKAAGIKYDVKVTAQFVEIYNEQINDLLRTYVAGGCSDSGAAGATTPAGQGTPQQAPSQGAAVGAAAAAATAAEQGGPGGWAAGQAGAGPKLEIRETPGGEVYVEGASQVEVRGPEDVARLMAAGSAVRATAAHKMNEASSRSHAIVTLTLEQRALPDARDVPPELRFLRSRLHLVDLAGSERQKDTGAEGTRFAEGVAINKGLLELGNVINALTEGAKRRHVPYRNSKLTRLLQDSLGGTAETLMLACVSPADVNHEQTLNTLRYAQRARAIKNSLRLNNNQSVEEELAYLRQLVASLQAENSALKGRVAELEGRGR